MENVRTIKDEDGITRVKEEDIKVSSGQYFNWLMNEENPRKKTDEVVVNEGGSSCNDSYSCKSRNDG